MSTSLDEKRAKKQKQLRKGTHSCEGCRNRRVRCVFSSNARVCDDCHRRGNTCMQQGQTKPAIPSPDSSKSIPIWAIKIERSLEEISRKVDLLNDSQPSADSPPNAQVQLAKLQTELVRAATHSVANHREISSSFSAQHTDHHESYSPLTDTVQAPLLSLMDKIVPQARHEYPTVRINEGIRPSSDSADRPMARLLQAILPSPLDILSIVRASRCAWDIWHGVLPITLASPDLGVAFSRENELAEGIFQMLPTDDLTILAKLMFGLAVCLQQLPEDFDFVRLGLGSSQTALQEKIVAAAESVLAAHQRLASTIDGIECMVIQWKYYVGMGKPRIAWLIGQRALSICSVFGVYSQSDHQSDEVCRRWDVVRLDFWGRDRGLSLILGLSYSNSVPRSYPPIEVSVNSTEQRSNILWTTLGLFCSQVVDRNSDPSKATYSNTLNLDQEMEKFESSIPEGRREHSMYPSMSLQAANEFLEMRFSFYNIRKLLHLPYMLKALTDRRFEYSRDAALQASREMILIYKLLRGPARPTLPLCNVDDFLSFTAALVLIVNLLGSPPNFLNVQAAQRDWVHVEDIAAIFRQLKSARACKVAAQSLPLLDDFLQARYEFPCTMDRAYEASIPYFGRIRLTRRNVAASVVTMQPLPPQARLKRQDSSSTAMQGSIGFEPNIAFTQAELIPASSDPIFDNMPVGAEWPELAFDLDQDWGNSGLFA